MERRNSFVLQGNIAASFSFSARNDASAMFSLFIVFRQEAKTARIFFSHPLPSHIVNSRYPNISLFCFPGVDRVLTEENFSYTFVLTNDEGARQYGHCTRTVNGDAFLFISNHAWCNIFNHLVYLYRANGAENGQRMIKNLYGVAVPQPQKVFELNVCGEKLKRPADHLCPFIDAEPVALLDIFTIDQLLWLLGAVMQEKHIAIVGPSYAVVSQICLGLLGIMYPFQWEHILIPVLPPAFVEVIAAPTPYIVGLVHSQLEQVEKVSLESLVLVNINENNKCEAVQHLQESVAVLPKTAATISSLRLNLRMLCLKQRSKRTSTDIIQVFHKYYADVFGDMAATTSPPSSPTAAANNNNVAPMNPEKDLIDAVKLTQAYAVLRRDFVGRLADGSWMENPFMVLCVRSHRALYPEQYKMLHPETTSSIAGAAAVDGKKTGAHLNQSPPGLGKMLFRSLGSWCGVDDSPTGEEDMQAIMKHAS